MKKIIMFFSILMFAGLLVGCQCAVSSCNKHGDKYLITTNNIAPFTAPTGKVYWGTYDEHSQTMYLEEIRQ